MKTGIDNYGLFPLELDPMQELTWAWENGAEGVQFSGIKKEYEPDEARLKELAQFAADKDLYLEWGGGQHIPLEMNTWKEKDIFAVNQKAAQQAAVLGASIVRSCSGGLMRWDGANPGTDTLLKLAAESLRSQRQMLRDYGVVLAIETHFEFTSFELIRLFEMCDAEPGDVFGICLDTMNLLTMLEEPLAAAKRLLPWVVSTHIKDGGIVAGSEGLVSFPAPMGAGIVDLPAITAMLSTLPRTVHLSIEDHGGHFDIPIYDRDFLSRFPDLTREELTDLIRLTAKTHSKITSGTLRMTSREEWPAVCEERLKADIRALKAFVE